jgi:tripartite-type tricarboxylate transporter receptor subunit TctC
MRSDVVGKLNAELNAILKMEDVKRRFEDQGVEPAGGPPSRFADHIAAEIQKWAKVVKDANIQPE